jgi:tRNA isopentenyl-2-thiomethyl-A-37 hydroxylase MiaE
MCSVRNRQPLSQPFTADIQVPLARVSPYTSGSIAHQMVLASTHLIEELLTHFENSSGLMAMYNLVVVSQKVTASVIHKDPRIAVMTVEGQAAGAGSAVGAAVDFRP